MGIDLTPDAKEWLASSKQIGGQHYKKCPIQPWDYVLANGLDYFQGSIVKYITRWRDKGGVEDLKKAKHFLDKYIEEMENGSTRGGGRDHNSGP